ncbi:MAG: S-layer homology domain-containing protein [Oscillospiraceae bacterium]|nr:S-layer homology domain-containing protein [Oscillospiraceae bacterium]
MRKRLLSLLIAAVMLLTMLPASVITAWANELPHIITYSFDYVSVYNADGEPKGEQVQLNKLGDYKAENWTYKTNYGTASRALTQTSLNFNWDKRGGSAMSAVVFAIDVDETMTYRPTMSHSKNSKSAYLKTYLLSETAVTENGWGKFNADALNGIRTKAVPLDNTYIDGFESPTYSDGNKHIFGDVTLTAGTYYLVFLIDGAREESLLNSNNRSEFRISYFRLTEADKFENAPEDKVYVKYAKLKTMGKQVYVTGYLSNGSTLESAGADISFASSDKSVAVVDEKSGTLTDNGIGTTTITATIKYNGEEIIQTAEYTVSDAPTPWSGEDVVYNFLDVSTEWTPQKVADAGFSDSDAQYPGDVRGVTYAYTGNWAWRGTGNSSGFGTWTPLPGHAQSGFLEDEADPETHFRMSYSQDSEMDDKSSYFSFNIKVPAAGRYSPTVEYSAVKGQGSADIYIIPVPDDNDDIYSMCTGDRYVGTFNNRDDNITGWEIRTLRLNDVKFDTAGEYVLVFKRGNVSSQVRFRKLFLNGKNDLESINVSVTNSEVCYGEAEKILVEAIKLNGETMDENAYTVTCIAQNGGIVEIDGTTLTGIGDGKEIINITVNDGSSIRTASVTVIGNDNTGVDHENTHLVFPDSLWVRDAEQLVWNIAMNSGNVLKFPFDENVEYVFTLNGEEREDVAYVDENGKLFANTTGIEGNVVVTARGKFKGETVESSAAFTLVLSDSKTEPSYYTYEKRANALKNASKYSWAKSLQKSVAKEADTYVENIEQLYDGFPEGGKIPSSYFVGLRGDVFYGYCRWCGCDTQTKYGNGKAGGWSIDPVGRPWKIQCPDCKRLFPSNDFELFYERCVEEYGYFDSKLARELNTYYVEVLGEKDALKNELYSNLTGVQEIGALREGETIEEWGVDDGWGYVPTSSEGYTYCANATDHTHTCKVENPSDTSEKHDCITENHCYIAFYMNQLIGYYTEAIKTLTKAYLYTGDMKYGRAGAVLVDRLSDIYPTYDYTKTSGLTYFGGGGNSGMGHMYGKISDASMASSFCQAADAFFPALDDEWVISFLTGKSESKWKGRFGSKASALDIWRGWEKNLLCTMWDKIKSARIDANFGMDHHALALSALVLNKEPETSDRIEYIFQTSENQKAPSWNQFNAMIAEGKNDWYSGGDMDMTLIDKVDRDGMGDESAPGYLSGWLGRLYGVAEAISMIDGTQEYDLFANPKFIAMHTAFRPIIVSNTYHANIGDTEGTAYDYIQASPDAYLTMFKGLDEADIPDDVRHDIKKEIAEILYITADYDISSINYGMFDDDPERIQEEILELLNDKIPVFDSEMMTGYAFAILRDGAQYSKETRNEATDTQRSFYMLFGRNTGHTHGHSLNLGMDAYGLNIAPDLGYATISGYYPERYQWTNVTLSHNTVSVDRQKTDNYTNIHGWPHHFDDSGRVQVMDISQPEAYSQVDEFRRTVVMVQVDDSVSYGVDFFRVTGGKVHTYSFHSQAENAYPVEGLLMTEQKDENGNWIGSYAANFGAPLDYPVGKDPNSPNTSVYETVYPRGYTWLGEVRRDTAPDGQFAVEFDVEDYRKIVDGGSDIVLRMTQMNPFDTTEVAICKGPIPERNCNKPMPRWMDWVLVQRESENDEPLDSLFTTVLEPYKEGRRYVKAMNACTVEIKDGTENDGDMVRAVKVEHENGRIDYIVYATNNSVTYRVDDLFDFRGFVGVYTVNDENVVTYRYVHDGNVIGSAKEPEQNENHIGYVTGYQTELSVENYIDIDFGDLGMTDEEINSEFSNKYVFIENDAVENGVYRIYDAKPLENGSIRLNTGLVTQIRSLVDAYDTSKGYAYNIQTGQRATVYKSFVDESLPEIAPVGDNLSTSAGSSIKVDITATSPIDADPITYIGTSLPRGASLNSESGVVTWKPDASQVGENHFVVTARDADGREATLHFTVTVYGSTTGGSSSDKTDETDKSEAGTPSGGGGGGGGGAAPTDKTDEKDNAEDSSTDVGTGVPDCPPDETEKLRFTDLSNCTWAADAINALAADGIIKGTSASTFSPAANITRADFALLLVRAFNLASNNAENFADVSANDYFASELAIARNCGIVGGIGDNKFAPRNPITRQDMMVIAYRALQTTTNPGVGEGLSADQYPDLASVAPYAQDAVSALISAGLVNGKSGIIAPLDHTTRAEVAVLIKRILDYIK